MTSCRYGTVLYHNKMKIKNWVLLAYCFTERHRTHASTVNEVSLPKEGYVDRTLIYQPGQSFGGLDTSECCVEMISRRTNQKSVGKDLFLKVTSPCLDNVVAKLYTTLTTHFLYFLLFRKALGSLTILTTMFKRMKICLVKQS